jgi:CysZ protein
MFSALPLALSQLGDPRVRRVLVKSLLLTLAIALALAVLAGWLLTGTNPCGLGPLNYDCSIGLGAGTLAAILMTLLGLWLLFPAIAIGVMGIFSDEVVEAVEARHYPAAAASGRSLPIGRSIALGLRSAGRILLWNILALPFYILLLVTGIGPFILFLAVNALALGRDLGEMVAVRHLKPEELERWLQRTRFQRALLGTVATGLFMIPLANLLAPVLSAAMAAHLFHKERK